MRAIRVASAALLGVASLALTAPTATAADDKGTSPIFTITPSTVSPGGRVTLSASGCNTTATAASGVFDTVSISPGSSAGATVDLDARPGAQYSVQFNCPGQGTGSFNLTITGGRSTPTTRSTVTPQGVRGGLGGSVGSMNPAEIAGGSALVMAAATATFFVIRRRSHSRQH
ncbi:hypothetical protein AB0F96_02165 [Streptomyces sp. NPDC023998]|uniref:hypothetical protein n=1 Tax=Streptomyces sp. NPDC023998 TaxID=3154597 RepID=UPI0033EF358A